MPDYLVKTLEYYFEDGLHIIFEKYTIDTLGIIKHKKSGQMRSYGNGTYNTCTMYDNDGKQRNILVARAVASTFIGKPPTLEHTADHIKRDQKKSDALSNIRWLCKSGQAGNRIMPKTLKSAFIIVKDGIEKTINEWVQHMNTTKMPEEDRDFTKNMIIYYAQMNKHGFAYKVYPKLEGEKWKEIMNSKTTQGHWEISNMNRVKYITRYAENVLWGERLGRINGYPIITINGKMWLCHILAFKTFYPELWDAKKPDEMVLHEDDNKEDFRPHKLRLGTASDNGKDAYDNGKRDGTKSARMRCASYIDGIHEENHVSQHHAAEYLKSKGYPKASQGKICNALSNKCIMYGRTWQKIV